MSFRLAFKNKDFTKIVNQNLDFLPEKFLL